MMTKPLFRAFMSAIASPLLWFAYALSSFFPRSAEFWVFGSYKNLFNDNSKYMFLETASRDGDITAVWLSGSAEVVTGIRALGFKAHLRWSPAGVWCALKAGVHIYSSYLSDTNFWLSGRSIRVNLWHGVPLKKIGRDIDSGTLYKRHHGSFVYRLPYLVLAPYYFSAPHYVLAPSAYLAEILSRATGARRQAILDGRYPRLDAIAQTTEQDDRYDRLLRDETNRAASMCFRPDDGIRILYAPTWRDGDRHFVAKIPVDWADLDKRLAATNATLFVKLHPNSAPTPALFDGLERIRLLSEVHDIYPVMSRFDGLITDYSSIYYDFLVVDREIVFFPYDLDAYLADSRSLYGDYDQMTPGVKVRTGEDLGDVISRLNAMDYAAERDRVRRLVWGNANRSARRRLKELLYYRAGGQPLGRDRPRD